MNSNNKLCIYCLASCEDFLPEHLYDCPSNTNLFPVLRSDLLLDITCMDCSSLFTAGDFYVERLLEDNIYEIVCTGCAALTIGV